MINYNPVQTPDRGQNGTLTTTVSDTSGASNPISVNTAKSWSKIDTDADDSLVAELIDEVTAHIERTYNIPIVSKDVVATWDSYSKQVKLPYTPVSSITTVKRIETDGDGTQTETTLTDNQEYRLVGNTLYFNGAFPYKDPYSRVSLEVTYVSAFSTVPNDILLGLKKCILSNYSDREDLAGMTIVELPNGSKSFFSKYISFDN